MHQADEHEHFVVAARALLGKYWRVLGKQKPIGLVQRCLFSFGSQRHRHNSELIDFFPKVFAPIARRLFTYIVQNLGPKSAKVAQRSLGLTPEQTRLVSRAQQTLAMCGQKKTMAATLRDAMLKALCWLGTSLITNQVLDNAFQAMWRGRHDFDRHVSDAAFRAAVRFIARRYLNGIAVVTTCIAEQLWIGMDLQAKPCADDPQNLLLRVLRKSAWSTVTVLSICEADLSLQREAASDDASTRARARDVCHATLQRLCDLGLGVYIPAREGEAPKV